MKKKFKFVVLSLVLLLAIKMPLIANAQIISIAEDTTSQNSKEETRDITQVIAGNDKLKTLSSTIKSAGLEDTLKGNGPFTVFAPTDEAFSKLPKETLADLQKPENKEKLVSILTYHVANKQIDSAALLKLDGKEITTANGKKAKISVKDNNLYINNSNVTTNDIKAKNGIIHIIDIVLLPE